MMNFPKGATFRVSGPVTLTVNGVDTTNITGWSIYGAHLRKRDGRLIEELTATILQYNPGIIQLQSTDNTQEWPEGEAEVNVIFQSPAGEFIPTLSAKINILWQPTKRT